MVPVTPVPAIKIDVSSEPSDRICAIEDDIGIEL